MGDREIKFRTWDPAGKFFEYFDLHEIPHGCATCPYTAQQYTGLKDKNAKEIYEGDILEEVWSFNKSRHSYVVCFGIHEDGCSQTFGNGFYLSSPEGQQTPMFCTENHSVVGNIFETPELLQPAQ